MIMDEVRAAMQAQGISQRHLAELVGVTAPDISNWLNGKRSLSAPRRERILTALGLIDKPMEVDEAVKKITDVIFSEEGPVETPVPQAEPVSEPEPQPAPEPEPQRRGLAGLIVELIGWPGVRLNSDEGTIILSSEFPVQRFCHNLDELGNMLRQGDIGPEVYDKAVASLLERFDRREAEDHD